MKVHKDTTYRLIFSIKEHPKLGAVIEPYIVAETSQRTLSLTYQKVFSGNASYYTRLSQQELELIALLDPIMEENIVKLFSPVQRIRPKEYFKKYFVREEFKDKIRPFIEEHIVLLLKQLHIINGELYLADDINPAAVRIQETDEFAKVLFHVRKNPQGTRYFATVKYKEERVPFMKVGAVLLSNQPAYLVVQNKLYRFYDFVEGNRIAAFINRKFIVIRPEQEERYYKNYIAKLMERSPVFVQGAVVEQMQFEATPKLSLDQEGENYFFRFKLRYGPFEFCYHPSKHQHVHLEWGEVPKFTKVRRSRAWEDKQADWLQSLGLKLIEDRFILDQKDLESAVNWWRKYHKTLEEASFEFGFDTEVIYTIDQPKINYNISEELDWFDVKIIVNIGQFKVPFKALAKNIKAGRSEYVLEDGSVFLIPSEWFALADKLEHSKGRGSVYKVAKFQLDVLDNLKSRKIKKHLLELEEIREEQPHAAFKGDLRPYQLEGLSWLMFLYRNRFGGILADDMGLGKTVQTLAYLHKVHKEHPSGKPFLLVAPTSLLFNWEQEAAHFVPDLKVYIHSGQKRARDLSEINADLIISSYGLIRNDFELFSAVEFSAIVLDESQHIKNQSTKATQLINKLKGDHRLCLSGTPIENSISDLWSQMNFLNKGLLGSSKQFQLEYVKPIEKDKNKERTEDLRKKVKPFVLRRTKQQVAKDLPDLTEKTILCAMEASQKTMYEEVKSEYRNALLGIVEEQGMDKARLSILQGLTKLRQLANHPRLVDPEFKEGSGKHTEVLSHLMTVVNEGHRVLVFSQFVSYLEILASDLDKLGVPYLKLTGATPVPDRRQRVNAFQQRTDHPVFLISLKAGGVGLNLTAADYVFITDPWWNPATEAQARDRTHRIGQTNKVISYKFITSETVEEKILELQNKKSKFATDIIEIEDNVIKNLNTEDLGMLLS